MVVLSLIIPAYAAASLNLNRLKVPPVIFSTGTVAFSQDTKYLVSENVTGKVTVVVLYLSVPVT